MRGKSGSSRGKPGRPGMPGKRKKNKEAKDNDPVLKMSRTDRRYGDPLAFFFFPPPKMCSAASRLRELGTRCSPPACTTPPTTGTAAATRTHTRTAQQLTFLGDSVYISCTCSYAFLHLPANAQCVSRCFCRHMKEFGEMHPVNDNNDEIGEGQGESRCLQCEDIGEERG